MSVLNWTSTIQNCLGQQRSLQRSVLPGVLFRLLPLPPRLHQLRCAATPSAAAATRGGGVGAELLHGPLVDGDVTPGHGWWVQHRIVPCPPPPPSSAWWLNTAVGRDDNGGGGVARVRGFHGSLFIRPPVCPTVWISYKRWRGRWRRGRLREVWSLNEEVRLQVLALAGTLQPRRRGRLLMTFTADNGGPRRGPGERRRRVPRFLAGRGRTQAHDNVPGVVGGVCLGAGFQGGGLRQGLLIALRGILVPGVAVLVLGRGTLLGLSCKDSWSEWNKRGTIWTSVNRGC